MAVEAANGDLLHVVGVGAAVVAVPLFKRLGPGSTWLFGCGLVIDPSLD